MVGDVMPAERPTFAAAETDSKSASPAPYPYAAPMSPPEMYVTP